MRGIAVTLAVLGVCTGAAQASDDRHDETLARAAADIVASKMGPLRGALDPSRKLMLVQPIPAPPRRAEPAPPNPGEGLARAVERKPSASPEL